MGKIVKFTVHENASTQRKACGRLNALTMNDTFTSTLPAWASVERNLSPLAVSDPFRSMTQPQNDSRMYLRAILEA